MGVKNKATYMAKIHIHLVPMFGNSIWLTLSNMNDWHLEPHTGHSLISKI